MRRPWVLAAASAFAALCALGLWLTSPLPAAAPAITPSPRTPAPAARPPPPPAALPPRPEAAPLPERALPPPPATVEVDP